MTALRSERAQEPPNRGNVQAGAVQACLHLISAGAWLRGSVARRPRVEHTHQAPASVHLQAGRSRAHARQAVELVADGGRPVVLQHSALHSILV